MLTWFKELFTMPPMSSFKPIQPQVSMVQQFEFGLTKPITHPLP
jgi:hypothetical protein